MELESFKQACSQQEVNINPIIMKAAERGHSYAQASYEPRPLLSAVVEAGRTLRAFPGSRLANRPLAVTTAMQPDIGAVTLAAMVSGSINAVVPAPGEYSYNHVEPVAGIATCSSAEPGFLNTFRVLQAGAAAVKAYGCQIITDDAGKPLFVRKSDGEPSSLALQSFIVNGIRFPRGSLARVRLVTDETVNDPRSLPYIAGNEVRVVPADQIDEVGFKRLSTFLTSAVAATVQPANNPFTPKRVNRNKLDKFTEIAGRAVRLLG